MHAVRLMTLVLAWVFCSNPGIAQNRVDLSTKAETGVRRIEAPENMQKLELNIVWGERLRPPSLYSRSLINLTDALKKWTTIPVGMGPIVRLSSPDIMKQPILIISTDEQFDLTPAEIENLRQYIENGGFLLVDDAGADAPNSPSGASLRAMVREIAGRNKMIPVSPENSIFQAPFFLGGPPQGLVSSTTKLDDYNIKSQVVKRRIMQDEPRELQGVFIDDRLAILYSPRGYYAKWNDMKSEPQLKFGVNVIMYALNLE